MSRAATRARGMTLGALCAASLVMVATPGSASAASCGSVSGPGGASPGFTSWAQLQAALSVSCSAGDEFTVNLTANITAVSGDSPIVWQRAGTLTIAGPDGATGSARPVLDATAVGDSAIRTVAAYTYGPGTRGSVALRNVIVTGGARSGVLAYFGHGADVTLDNAKVSGNSVPSNTSEAGGITNNSVGGGVALLNGSEVSGNTSAGDQFAGGIYSGGPVTITDSTVSGNTATGSSAAGGVKGDDTVTVTSSTIANNAGTGDGGGVAAVGALSITASTLSGNSTTGGAGAAWSNGTVTLTNATVTGNAGGTASTGGIRSTNSLTARFSTISGNTRPTSGYSDVLLGANNPLALTGSIVGGTDADACSATAANRTASYSLSTSLGCLPASLGTSAVTTTGSLGLGALAANGGSTQTRLPANASVAVGLAPDALGTGIATDQRGVARAGLFTVGAVQVALPLAPTAVAAAPGLQAVSLGFIAGSDAGSVLTNYEYALSTDGGNTYGAWTPLSPAATSSPFTITGLTGGIPYDIKVRAANAVGPGQPSAAVAATPVAPNGNASLSSLTADAAGVPVALAPVFSTGTTGYTASVGNGVEAIVVTPTASDPYAAVTVNGVPTASGVASAAVPLTVGANTITVTVTASDGTTIERYVLTVLRAAPTSSQQAAEGGAAAPPVDPPSGVLPTGRVSAGTRALVARVTTPGPGVVVARGTAAGVAGPACLGRRAVAAAGTFAVQCVLAPRARAALMRGPLRIRMGVRYVGASGAIASSARVVVVPRRTIRTPVTG